jgi:hypothetical protein
MSSPDFPPTTQLAYSVRKGQLEVSQFLAIRKAVSENEKYRNPDGTQLMSYVETLHDRENTRNKVLEFELAQGWLIDDRGATPAPVATTPVVQEAVPQVVVPVPVASPIQAIAVAQPTEPQVPSMDNSTSLPTTKLRRAKPNLGTTLAPPLLAPLPATQSAVPFPQPPPGATVMGWNGSSAVPSTTNVTVPAPPPMTMVSAGPTGNQTIENVVDLKPIIDKIDKLGKGLEQISGDQEAQKTTNGNVVNNLNEMGKALTALSKAVGELNQNMKMVMTAVHHMYITSPGTAKILADSNINLPTSNDFQTYLQKYLPQ